jgi:hypothetical protein
MASTADTLAFARATAKQERWEYWGWYAATEMSDAQALLTGPVLRMEDDLFVPWLNAQFILNEDQMEVILEKKAALALGLAVSSDTDILTHEGILAVIAHDRDWRMNEEALREAEEEEAMADEGGPACADCGEASWRCGCNDLGMYR